MTALDDLRAAASDQLDRQAARARLYQAYFDDEAGIIALLDTEERRIFKQFLAECQANWSELIVNAVAERLEVDGFRVGSAQDSEQAWTIWQASSMDADSELCMTDGLITGQGLVLVQPDEANPTGVSITVESPQQACVLYEPGNRRRRMAGYKRFGDLGGKLTEVLVLPDAIWTWHPDGQVTQEPNPVGAVSLIELVPQPRTLGPPRSELHSATSIVDRIHTTLFARCVSVDYGANRQITATGVKLRRDTVTGPDGTQVVKLANPFQVGADRLLISENPESRFGAIPESNLKGYLEAVQQDVEQLAAITQTPSHYLVGTVANLSADAIKAAEAGLIAKVKRRARHLGEGWEEVIRTALSVVGNPAAVDVSAEVIWQNPETRSLGQLVDALVKLRTIGVPLRVLWEQYGLSPQEIERWEELAQAERRQPEQTGATTP